MRPLGLIAGSAYRDLLSEDDAKIEKISTEFGEAFIWLSSSLAFIPRHGLKNDTPPHRINHRANMSVFKKLDIARVIGVNSTGSLKKSLSPQSLIVPHDYLNPWGIETVFDGEIRHITPGLDEETRNLILTAARRRRIDVVNGGIYIQTTGPRLETRAEIEMLKSYGDVVGMTMANEATISKELDLAYASLCSVDNFCHGITEVSLGQEEILNAARQNVKTVKEVIYAILEELT